MALFKILKGNESNLPTTKTEGYAYFTEDKGNFFVDVSSSKRMQLNASHAQYDLEEFASPTGQNSAKLPIHEKYLKISGGVVDGNITADTFIGVHKGNISGVTETEPTSATSYSPLFINTGGSAADNTTVYSRRANQDFNIRIHQGTASAAGYAVLDLGNATATGTAGNKYGAIKLFSEKTGSVTLKSNTASTSNVTATFPAYSGNVTISATSAQNPTSAATYNIPFYINNSNRVSYNDGLRYNTIEGTASALGQSNLYLGNSTASGTAKNKYGCILIYGQNANYTRLRARQTPAFNQSTFYLPAGDEANDACYAIWSPNEATAVGSATQPVYIAANGKAVACTAYSGGTAVTLNGTSKAGSTASIYTPTAAGTNGQILASTGGAPGWVNQSTIAAGTAAKLANTRAINGTNFDGTADITTAKWGTARTISISGTAGTTGTSINGSANATLTIPTTLSGFTKITSTKFVGALTGNATSATKATQDGDGKTISSTYLKLSGGTMTGPIKNGSLAGSWVNACNGEALINSTEAVPTNGKIFSPMLSSATANGRMAIAFYTDALQVGYITKENCDAGTNTLAASATLFNEEGGAYWSGSIAAGGNITLAGDLYYSNIKGTTNYADKPVMQFKPGNADGCGVIIGGGALTVVGGGESAANFVDSTKNTTSTLPAVTTEALYLTSDGNIFFATNCQNGYETLVGLNTSRSFYPSATGTGSIGTSTYRWGSSYIVNLNASGTATIGGATTLSSTLTVTGATTLNGATTVNNTVNITNNTKSSSKTTGALKVKGGIGTEGQINAQSVKINDVVKFQYNDTDKCLDIIFE